AHTAAAEPSAAFACAFAVLTAVAFARERTTSALLWMVVATVFAAHFRPESFLVTLVAVTIVCLYAPAEFARPRTWWGGLMGLVFGDVHIGHMVAMRHEGWGTSGARLSTTFAAANLDTNGGFFLGDARFPVVYSALSGAGRGLF